MPRVLLYVNISLMDNPRADGCEIFAKNLIKSVLSKDSNYHFYVMTDSQCIADFVEYAGHVTVIPWAFRNEEGGAGWARFQRYHFNMKEAWDKLVKYPAPLGGYDYDLVFNQQPEITPNFTTLLNSYKGGYYGASLEGFGLKRAKKWTNVEALRTIKATKMSDFKLVPFVNYFQVLAVPGDERYDPVEFFRELEGVLAADITLMPSNWIMQQVLAVCRSMFTEKFITTLKSKMKVLYFGIPFQEFETYKVKNNEHYPKFTIGWNSRILAYTGFDVFAKYMAELWKLRKDFQVIFFDPLGRAEHIKEQYPQVPISIRRVPREQYIKELSMCDVVAGTFRFQQFPQALTDAMICGIPIISVNKFAVPEIAGPKYPWLYDGDKDFLVKIQQIMDSQNERKKWGEYLRGRAKELFDWDIVIPQYMKILEDYAAIKMPEHQTELMPQLLKWILDRGGATKKDIYEQQGWGMTFSQIPWYRYRKMLLASNALTEDYSSPITQFLPKTHGQTTLTMLKKEPELVQFGEQPSALELEFPEEELNLEFE